MTRQGKVALVGLVAAVFAAPAGARATTLLPADLGELVREADVIVRGRVAETRPMWVEGRRAVDTVVTLAAEEYFKGHLGPEVHFRVPGGQLGRYRSIVPGAPVFVAGEPVIVLLHVRGPAWPVLVGLGAGVFRIVAETASEPARLVVPLVAPTGTAARLVRGDPTRRPVTVDAFRQRVAQYLAGRGAAAPPRNRPVDRLSPRGSP